jgi:Trypsin
MRHALLVRAAAVALTAGTLSACSDQAPTAPAAAQRPDLITNGTPTGTSYGYVGSVLAFINDTTIAYCTGTLIAPTVFLTAGHCTDYPAGTPMYVTFQPTLSAPIIPATAWYTHPDYDFPYNDLGIVILPEGSTTGITPADIPTLGYLDDALDQGAHARTPAVIVGYGTRSLGRGNTVPEFTGTRQVAETRILQVLDEFLIIAANAVNAGKRGGSCFGDSGGPLFLAGDVTTVVGVTSFGNSQSCTKKGGYVRIDTELALSFITPFLE